MAPPKKYEHIDFTPPAKVRDRAEQGLALRREQTPSNKGGLSTQEADGIGSGVQRAVNLKAGDPVSPEVARKMRGFFSRFRKLIRDSRTLLRAPKDEQLASKMLVADLLWGGPEAEEWIEEVVRQMDEADEAEAGGKQAALPRRRQAAPLLIRIASDGWEHEVEAFNDVYRRALRITDLTEGSRSQVKDVLDELASALDGLRNMGWRQGVRDVLPPLPSGLPERDPYTLLLVMHADLSGEESYPGDLFADWQEVKAWLPKVVRAFQSKVVPLLQEPAPGGSFRWEGLLVENRDGLPESKVRPMLDAVAQGLALFKRRGMSKLVASELTGLVLHSDDSDYHGGARPANASQVAGWYEGRAKTIHLLASQSASPAKAGKMTARWFTEIFVHEFGHHVHMNYLTPAARAHWDDAWEEVSRLKAEALAASKITWPDVSEFIAAQWTGSSYRDWADTGRQLKGLLRGKYLYALHEAGWSKSPVRVSVSDEGKRMLAALRIEALFNQWTAPGARIKLDPSRALVGICSDWLAGLRGIGFPLRKELPETVRRDLDERAPGLTFTPDAFADLVEWVNRPFYGKATYGHVASTEWGRALKRLVGSELTEEAWAFMEERDVTIRQEADRLLERLGVPTDYGKTNVLEDFAETFVLFVAAPDQLTGFQRWRMGRALGISASQGKPVFARKQRRPSLPRTRHHAQR